MPKQAITDSEIESCFDVMSALRTHLQRETFLSTVRHMETEGFRLAYIKSEGESESDGIVVAAAGYRIYNNLFMGKHLYVDDLVTLENARSKGYGEKMIKWLRGIAKENDCKVLHLDSGTQRGAAHKFYFSQGFTIASYHFSEALDS